MSDNNPQAAEADPPIIVSGGGSVNLDLPTQYKEKGKDSKYTKYKSETGNLASIEIDGKSYPLTPTSKIVIRFK